ncbi:MAG: large conductance mechanosensitive channel protein MscL [Phycisphaerales bacterium]|nr:large conductance mechanosensitive channel protein MscL [Phycisphaerales bacterium]
MGFVQEFREFAVKGNVVDMAVGIILGASFNKIVNSMVNDILMPPIGMALGRVEFKDLQILLRAATMDENSVVVTPEVAMRYGMFINTIIEFLIVGLSVFFVIKVMNRVLRQREAAAA